MYIIVYLTFGEEHGLVVAPIRADAATARRLRRVVRGGERARGERTDQRGGARAPPPIRRARARCRRSGCWPAQHRDRRVASRDEPRADGVARLCDDRCGRVRHHQPVVQRRLP